jgi:hypothetical protein
VVVAVKGVSPAVSIYFGVVVFSEIVELFLCLNMQQIFANERLRGQQSKY